MPGVVIHSIWTAVRTNHSCVNRSCAASWTNLAHSFSQMPILDAVDKGRGLPVLVGAPEGLMVGVSYAIYDDGRPLRKRVTARRSWDGPARRRSVLVRMTEDGRKLGTSRISNSPAGLRPQVVRPIWSRREPHPGCRGCAAVQAAPCAPEGVSCLNQLCWSMAEADRARPRRTCFWILPVEVLGSSVNTTVLGALK